MEIADEEGNLFFCFYFCRKYIRWLPTDIFDRIAKNILYFSVNNCKIQCCNYLLKTFSYLAAL